VPVNEEGKAEMSVWHRVMRLSGTEVRGTQLCNTRQSRGSLSYYDCRQR